MSAASANPPASISRSRDHPITNRCSIP